MWDAVDRLVRRGIEENNFPGCAIAVGQGAQVLYTNVQGYLTRDAVRLVTGSTRYDVGRLTQSVATTPLCLHALEEGLVSLDDSISLFLPNVPVDKKEITLHHLLTHTSGLSSHFLLAEEAHSDTEAVKVLLRHPLSGSVGGKVRDSAMGFLLLGFILEKVYSIPLDEAVKRYVAVPMGMSRTGYLPSGQDVAPTAVPDENGEPQAGWPLDDNARFLHGVAGHAGLFTTINDMTRFASMLACRGRIDNEVYLAERSVHLAVTDRTRGMNEARGF
ncbi:MAG: serine hydrolase, partial [Eubacteriales bacterium]|nr:serine hydrolase [Eubacteriales bacterium]